MSFTISGCQGDPEAYARKVLQKCGIENAKQIDSPVDHFFLTGISQQDYCAAVRAGTDIIWFCPSCVPECLIAESTRVSETSTDILESEEFNPPVRDESANLFTDQSTNPSVRDASADLFTDQSANPPVSDQSAGLFAEQSANPPVNGESDDYADQSTVYDPPAQPVIE